MEEGKQQINMVVKSAIRMEIERKQEDEQGNSKIHIGDKHKNKTEVGTPSAVYYISLVATDKSGHPYNERYVFDVASKLEMENTGVQVIDIPDLVDFYYAPNAIQNERTITKTGKLKLYDFVESFVERNRNSAIIIDECPILKQRGNNILLLLIVCTILTLKISNLTVTIFIYSNYLEKRFVYQVVSMASRQSTRLKVSC